MSFFDVRLRRLSVAVLALAALALPTSLVRAALTTTPQTKPSLAGQLLVATPDMGDPRFARTVILMVRHDQNGAFGIVINRPLGDAPLAELLHAIGDKDASTSDTVRLYAGGPVQPEVCVVIHSADYHQPGTIDIDGKIAATLTPEVLRDIASGHGPQKTLVALGYAGWGPGQLEDELKRNAWYLASQDPALVFDDDRDKLWEHAVARRTQDL